MNDPLETPDRRPLVYGGAAIIILLVAAFLFWPRGDDSIPLDNAALVPGSAQTRASDASIPPPGPGDAGLIGAGGDSGLGTDLSAMDELGTEANPKAETRIVEDETPAVTTPPVKIEAPKTETSKPAPTRTASRPAETSSFQPSSTGEWVLNVGSFGSRANADRRVEELARQGIAAHVQMASASGGEPVYRVRVGYFGNSTDAKRYAEWLKTSQGLDSWAAKR